MYCVSGLESGRTGICVYTCPATCSPSCFCSSQVIRGLPGSKSSETPAAQRYSAAIKQIATQTKTFHEYRNRIFVMTCPQNTFEHPTYSLTFRESRGGQTLHTNKRTDRLLSMWQTRASL